MKKRIRVDQNVKNTSAWRRYQNAHKNGIDDTKFDNPFYRKLKNARPRSRRARGQDGPFYYVATRFDHHEQLVTGFDKNKPREVFENAIRSQRKSLLEDFKLNPDMVTQITHFKADKGRIAIIKYRRVKLGDFSKSLWRKS